MSNSYKTSNNLDNIRVGGEWLTREEEIRNRVANAFKDLLLDTGFWRSSPEGARFLQSRCK